MSDIHKYLAKRNRRYEQTLMLHGLSLVTGDPSIHISYPFLIHPGVQITVSEPGDGKWVYMTLPMPRGSLIQEIEVAYHRTGIQSYITNIRLIEQQGTIAADVVHDEEIEQTLPSIFTIKSACEVVVKCSMLLKICMQFANTEDMIEFGSIEVKYIPQHGIIRNSRQEQRKRTGAELYKVIHPDQGTGNRYLTTLAEIFFIKQKRK